MGKRGPKAKKPRLVPIEQMQPFISEIKLAAEDLHFALKMYGIELADQGHSEDEINKKLREVFLCVAREIIRDDY